MIIEMGINPNCSEATVRIKINDVDDKAVKELIAKLELETNQEEESIGEWDDEKTSKKEFEWYETYISEETMFGIDCIKISGDAPYNNGDQIADVIDRFIKNAETEWSD